MNMNSETKNSTSSEEVGSQLLELKQHIEETMQLQKSQVQLQDSLQLMEEVKRELEEAKRANDDAQRFTKIAERQAEKYTYLLKSGKISIFNLCFNRRWLKVVFLICILIVFVLGGFAGVGAATAADGHPLALSNTEVLIQFVGTGWAFSWRAFIGLSTIVGAIQLIKWLFFMRCWK